MSASFKDDVELKGGRAPHAQLMHRFRLLAVSTVLMALAFIQDPGRIAADTKLDLAVNPMGFLSRALTLWEPLGFFGQLQNQAYGYLFPVGPFFVLGDLAGLPAWVVQRLWWSAVLIGAFLGAVRLARLLGVRGEGSRIIAGLAYALAPRMVTEIGVLTVEVVPFAVAPWVVIPLVMATQGRYSLRRGAALSGIAVLFAGGVNAVATIAVLPLGLLWIVTRCRGRVRWVLTGWWALAVGLATLWWVIPLMILGRYSPPFLDWIESSSITTLVTSPDTVLRGTSQWVAYVAEPGGPSWPGGWALVTTPVLILAGGMVAAIGLTGLALRSTPFRSFLVGGVLMGFTLVSLGHTGAVQGFGAETIQDLMDGALAPLRNTHKFDLVLRLPLAIGVGFAMDALIRRLSGMWSDASRFVAAGMVVLLAISAWPMVTGSLVRDRSFEGIPEYWVEVADWLAEESPHGRALVVPGASFGIYAWGRTQDEPLQPLAKSPWAIRDAVPLSSAGNIRWLDAIQERLDTGRGSPRLADALARAGVEYVVVRNDIDRRRSDTPRTVLIRQALLKSGGFTPAAGFGPILPVFRTENTVIDYGLQEETAAVEVWRVSSPFAPNDPRVALRDATRVDVISGSSESIIAMADADLIRDGVAVVLGDETPLENAPGVSLRRSVTDGFRRTEVGVGRSRDNRSQTLSADEAFVQDRRVHDYLPVDPTGRQSVARFEGGDVRASSSGSEVTALRSRAPSAQPWAALDGDPETAWVSGDLQPGVGQWWELSADEPFSAAEITVSLAVDESVGSEPSSITVKTDTGELTVPVLPTSLAQKIPLPAGETTTLRLTLASVAERGDGEGFGLREVVIPGVSVSRSVFTSGEVDGGSIVLSGRRGEQSECVAARGQWLCNPQMGRTGEERSGIKRTVQIGAPGSYQLRMWVRPKPGAALNAILMPFSGASIAAESTTVGSTHPARRAQAAVDGEFSTAWSSSPLDAKPQLDLTLGEERLVRGVRIETGGEPIGSRPLRVTVIANGRETEGIVAGRGTILIPAQQTNSLTLRFESGDYVRNLDGNTGMSQPLPIAVREVQVLGAQDLPKGPGLANLAGVQCGFGPELVVGGKVVAKTQVSTSVARMLADDLLSALPCSGDVVELAAGSHEIEVMSTAEFTVEAVVLEPVRSATSGLASRIEVLKWDKVERLVFAKPESYPRILETNENFNDGWQASRDGQLLEAVRVDGWRQGWLLPAGSAGLISLSFAPQAQYLAGLILGLLGVTILGLLCLGGRRCSTPQLVSSGKRPGLTLLVMSFGAAALIAGLPGLVVAGGIAVLGRRWTRSRIVVTFSAAAAVGAALLPGPGGFSRVGVLGVITGLLAVGAMLASCLPGRVVWSKLGEPK